MKVAPSAEMVEEFTNWLKIAEGNRFDAWPIERYSE